MRHDTRISGRVEPRRERAAQPLSASGISRDVETGTEIVIAYCEACGYRRAAEIAAERLRVALQVPVRLSPGGRGDFEVSAAGRVVFSRHREGRIPDERDLLSRLAMLS